jgi:hypothetical protein
MSIDVFIRDVHPTRKVQPCTVCHGTQKYEDYGYCPYCDDGTEEVYEYPEGAEPVNMANGNAFVLLEAIDKQFNPKDPCGYWDESRMSVILVVIDAMIATGAYDYLVRRPRVEGNTIIAGIDEEYLNRRLTQIRELILTARKMGKTVAYA